MALRATLGYHTLGDYHYFTVLKSGNQLLGHGEETFRSHEEFASLVTAVHEHYHLMQEMQSGFCWWRQDTRDNLAVEAIEAVKSQRHPVIPLTDPPDPAAVTVEVKQNDPVSYAAKYSMELQSISRYVSNPDFTRDLLSRETEDSPQYARLIAEQAFELTTLDLMECHAAVLTELYVSKLVLEMPWRFDTKVVEDLAPLFRVNQMQAPYRRALEAMLHLFHAVGVKLELPETHAHRMYSAIPNGVYYLLLAFFLDYALHLPPSPLFLLHIVNDVGSRQDIYPPFRFLNLAMVWAFGVRNNKDGLATDLTNEALYYSVVADKLCAWINDMHSRVRDPGTESTFLTMKDTTELWGDCIRKSRLGGRFPEGQAIWSRALDFRLSKPDSWFNLDPQGFEATIGLPRLYITSGGLGCAPYLTDRTGTITQENAKDQMEYLTRALTLHYSGFGTGSREDYARFPVTLVPYRFVEESMGRESLYRASSFLLYGEPLRCPLTQSVGAFVPCKPRNARCEAISDVSELPANDCLLRETITNHFGDPAGFRQRKATQGASLLTRLLGR